MQVLRAVFSNRFVMSSLDDGLRAELKALAMRYCPLTEEFFSSEEEKKACYLKTWGFLPKANPITTLPPPLLQEIAKEVGTPTHPLTHWLATFLPTLSRSVGGWLVGGWLVRTGGGAVPVAAAVRVVHRAARGAEGAARGHGRVQPPHPSR